MNAFFKLGFSMAALKDKSLLNELHRTRDNKSKKRQKREKFQKSLDRALVANEDGMRFFNLNLHALALEFYSKAINYCGNKDNYFCAMFHDNRAAVYEKLNDLNNFHKDCNAAIEYDKNYTKAYRRRGKLLWKLGERDKAITDFTTVCILEDFENEGNLDAMERAIIETCQKNAETFFVKFRGLPNNANHVNRKYFREFNRHPIYHNFKIRNSMESEPLTVSKLVNDLL
ncbi:hypothetical protein B4U80_11817 [Leptotrombidium deliense]|uniref:Uncharacterized protein n=1 Tax=Leptotrombidium deliense TaxID=299467 RepID=A0A443S246_9ACAR|nr:hypothetical protein B4U80_11817 [Leptotrombidium deliense]